jgi:hypothetical protein
LVKDWNVYLDTPSQPDFYKVVFEWEHDSSDAVVVNGVTGGNPLDDPRCSGSSQEVASDGQPYWMPRFYPRPVSDEIKAKTGIQFASVDWQPCGHKDIKICHGESHYDFHLYYVPEAELAAMNMCHIGTTANPNLPVCTDAYDEPDNAAYFNLIKDNMPVSAKIGDIGSSTKVDKLWISASTHLQPSFVRASIMVTKAKLMTSGRPPSPSLDRMIADCCSSSP